MIAEINTARLLLRRWRPEDREPYAALSADPAVMEHYPSVLSRAQAEARVDEIEAEFARAGFLQANILEQPVVDQTGLTDRFDLNVRYTPDATQLASLPAGVPPPPAVSEADAPPDLFTAFQQQVGLKLESKKALVDVVVVDKVERPSDN